MKKILVCITLLLCINLVSCGDTREEYNVNIRIDEYLNTSETVTVNGYNGYKLIGSEQTDNEDGSITVILKFNQPIK